MTKVVKLIVLVSTEWPWETVWKEKNDDIRLKAVFFILRCRQWKEVLESKVSKRRISYKPSN